MPHSGVVKIGNAVQIGKGFPRDLEERRDTFRVVNVVIPLIVGLAGVVLGALLTRRNEKKSYGARLLVEALNDAVTAIAEVAGGEGRAAQNRYASAMSRIALHASPEVISGFRDFQVDATTATEDGRKRFIAAVQRARLELGHQKADDSDLSDLMFGASPAERFTARCNTRADFDAAIRSRASVPLKREIGDEKS